MCPPDRSSLQYDDGVPCKAPPDIQPSARDTGSSQAYEKSNLKKSSVPPQLTWHLPPLRNLGHEPSPRARREMPVSTQPPKALFLCLLLIYEFSVMLSTCLRNTDGPYARSQHPSAAITGTRFRLGPLAGQDAGMWQGRMPINHTKNMAGGTPLAPPISPSTLPQGSSRFTTQRYAA